MEIIVWIIVIGAIVSVKSRKRRNTGNTNGNRTVYYEKKTLQSQKKNFAIMPEHKKVPPNVERKCAVEDRHASENNVLVKRPVKAEPTPNVQRPYTEHTTQTRAERNKNRMAALRLYEGDHVPQGYRMVKCRYCAAENLIAYSSRGNYMCYFCHEDL